jgi:hypothetical protein
MIFIAIKNEINKRKTMTIKELIKELEEYDESLETATCDGYGSVDAILKVSVEKVNDRDDIVEPGYTGEATDVMGLGWNF